MPHQFRNACWPWWKRQRGLRSYAMFCPLLQGIGNSPDQIERLVKFAAGCHAEEVFIEPVNPQGCSLRMCEEALELWCYDREAEAVARIRKRKHWSRYVADLLTNVQQSVRKHSDIAKLRFLLYSSRLLPEDEAHIRQDDAGVIWLENSREARRTESRHNGEKSPCARGVDALR